MVIFEFFLKAMPPSLSESKVLPSFCFAFKIPDDRAVTTIYYLLVHSISGVKLKIQNEKLNPLPDPFALDWDNLSETEMKRLVGQLEKTRADLLVGILNLL